MINFNVEKIVPACNEFGLTLDQTAIDRLNTYGNMLVEWNEKMNLTAITEPEEVLYKHFLDCLLFFKNVDVPQNATVIDVGTGAGFPGMVLKIARPDIKLTLMDGLNKRLTFLSAVLEALNLDAAVVHSRAEDGGKKAEYRERYDIACARAVANLPVLCEYCIPFVKVGGYFIAMKGASVEEEIAASKNALKQLNAEIETVLSFSLPYSEDKRNIVVIKKLAKTLPKYPRNAPKPIKQPL